MSAIDNNNEVLIVLKEASASGIAQQTLEEMQTSSTIALAQRATTQAVRRTLGFANVDREARYAVRELLNNKNVTKFRAPDFGHVITATLPEAKTQAIIASLLKNPNVDYIEANQRHKVVLNAPENASLHSMIPGITTVLGNPQGTNPSDIKHTFHSVLDAWDYTRGSGVKIGILDSGFAYDESTGQYHSDGQLLNNTTGIKKLGFVDDYDQYGNCDEGAGQTYGNCPPWDDNGHGTAMTGIAGANDNNRGTVGIAPEALTISMKMAINCQVAIGCDGDFDVFEDDDFYWAVQWARNNDVDILSMSFGLSSINSTVRNALYNAYHNSDILLVASTGNPGTPSDQKYPRAYDYVMGIGGLYEDGSTYGVNEDQEVSALSGGTTLSASCTGFALCQPQGIQTFSNGNGGTSSSSAITAGIAALVRSYNPNLTAPEVRQRLKNTAEGFHNRVNALRAVTNDRPMQAFISGPGYVGNAGNTTWNAQINYANQSVSYLWEYKGAYNDNWQQVSTSNSYTRFIDLNGQKFLLRLTANSGTEEAVFTKNVIVASNDCPPQTICAR